MATRRSRRRSGPAQRPMGGVAGPEVREERSGREWSVRAMPGQSAVRSYMCPFCDREIRSGAPHLVIWPLDEPSGIEQRRHWHTQCWRRYR